MIHGPAVGCARSGGEVGLPRVVVGSELSEEKNYVRKGLWDIFAKREDISEKDISS